VDSLAGLYQYNPSAKTWSFVQSQVVQVGVTGKGVYVLYQDHLKLSFASTPYNNGAFSAVGANVGDLYAGPGGLAVTDLSTHYLMWRNEQAGTWTWQGAPGYMYAVTGLASSPALVGLPTDRSAVIASTSLSTTFPAWTVIGPPAGLLVGGGVFTFATGNILYNGATGGDSGVR
jgi:hypothetical protein